MSFKAALLISLFLTTFLLTKAATTGYYDPPTTCTGTINSLSDVSNAVKCTNVVLNGFTVPAGKGLVLPLLDGTTVNMKGDIAFGNRSWAGPLFTVSGNSITFNGNGHKFDGGGPFYWDGLGTAGSIKPAPMMKIQMSGVYTGVTVVNSPARVYSVSNPAPLVMKNLVIDNSQGDVPNSKSKGKAAGHNTDGFDCSTKDLIIQDSTVHNQDDCLAINRGSNIIFRRNNCTNGHGISIGSIDSGVTVSGIVIADNTIINNDQALRIKTKVNAVGSTVTNITYSGNIATGIRNYGVIIDQSYPSTLKTPGNGVAISGINFVAPASILTVNAGAKRSQSTAGRAAKAPGTGPTCKLMAERQVHPPPLLGSSDSVPMDIR
ncbi:glycoside hydrolase family 28 protein [Hebeloma cylindrosporum]|uniref:endo-polygalacturonase n=1 Tax=Hebeloma cylindrosporum TaxID=76867 RepID=A0A0C3C9D3_HEBCY|nr:glycoside hydrolase family 28 protein [Hebeloma cylindrosporum h7]